ncbi:MAG: hypothetical protein Q8M15_09005 [Bacteroidota bacterium]|nr:hypothetical protein [Bacteroidota bacterium]
MYEILLPAHNLLRWVFLAVALYTIFRALQGTRNQSPFGKDDNFAGAIFLATTHIQLLVGLILWFISNHVQTAIADMATSMHNPETRKLLIEHPLTMIIAVVIIQVGRIKSKKAYADLDKHKRCLWYYSIGLILVLSRIPWGAPMFRV